MTEWIKTVRVQSSNATGAAAEALLRACGAEVRSDFGRLTRAVCEAGASPELAATIRECAIILMGCAADLNRATARAQAWREEPGESELDELIAATLPTPMADGPAAERLSYHAIHALTAARQTQDDPSIRIAEELACLAGLALARRLRQQ